MINVLVIFFILVYVRYFYEINEYKWYTSYYYTMSLLGITLWSTTMTWSIAECANGILTNPVFMLYYEIQIAFYCACLVFVIDLDKRSESTDTALLIHHFVTVGLVTVAYLFPFSRVGFTILLLHDVSDAFLNNAKYFKRKYGKDDWKTTIVFVLFAVTFFILRLVCLPLFVFGRCWYILESGAHYMSFAGMIILIGLHCWWFVKIVKIAINLKNK